MLERLGAEWIPVATPEAAASVNGLIIPGGESTTLLKLLSLDPDLEHALRDLAKRGGAFYGTCAGAILLARAVRNPDQACLGFMDMEVARNGYGRQNESFVARKGDPDVEGEDAPEELVFIRAPRILETGPEVRVLTRVQGEPVYVEQGRFMATTFHPELSEDPSVHRRFLDKMHAD